VGNRPLRTWMFLGLFLALLAPSAQSVPAAIPASAPDAPGDPRIVPRRVSISLTFSGERVLLFGSVPPGCDDVVAVMEGPRAGSVRLMEKGRIVLFWLGVRQYDLKAAPGLYLVNTHCPRCDGMATCVHHADVAALNGALENDGIGEDALAGRIGVTDKGGGSISDDEKRKILRGYWGLEEARGLFNVQDNAIRITPSGMFYHVFRLPVAAPEGRYLIRTFFLQGGKLAGIAENELLVRKSGMVGWLSRMSERRPVAYGIFTVCIAIASGLLAGSIFRRGTKH
jgi:hypothetical protein